MLKCRLKSVQEGEKELLQATCLIVVCKNNRFLNRIVIPDPAHYPHDNEYSQTKARFSCKLPKLKCFAWTLNMSAGSVASNN